VYPSVSKVNSAKLRETQERRREKNKAHFSDHPTGQNKREVQNTLKIKNFLLKRNKIYIHSIACLKTGP